MAEPTDRPPGDAGAWLSRPKLWDDVFTRTVANVLSVGIIAAIAGFAGLISLNPLLWGLLAGVGAWLGSAAFFILATLPSGVRDFLRRVKLRVSRLVVVGSPLLGVCTGILVALRLSD